MLITDKAVSVQGQKCSFTGKKFPWVESYQTNRGVSYFMGEPCHLLLMHNKLCLLTPLEQQASVGFAERYLTCCSRPERPITIYYGVHGGYFGSAAEIRWAFHFGGFELASMFSEGAKKARLICVNKTKGEGVCGLLGQPKDRRYILKGAQINFHALPKPRDPKKDKSFVDMIQFHIDTVDKLFPLPDLPEDRPKWKEKGPLEEMVDYAYDNKHLLKAKRSYSKQEMVDIMKNIQKSYKALYATSEGIKTFYDEYISLLAKDLECSLDQARKFVEKDSWISSEEACDMGLFKEVLEPNEEISKDLESLGM